MVAKYMLVPLTIAYLPKAAALLKAACEHDNAWEVANEKVFGEGPSGGSPAVWGVVQNDQLIGVASMDANRIRLIAVDPQWRNLGFGSRLLESCVEHARRNGHERVLVMGQAGNYMAPGIDLKNRTAISWLRKRQFSPMSEVRTNLLVNLRDNPQVSEARALALAETAKRRGFEVRRAGAADHTLIAAVQEEFGGAWAFELERALAWVSRDGTLHGGLHVATKDGAYCAFAAHDGNNQGLGWFGPAGTWPAHRGLGLGEALLIACLVDVAREHEQCEIAWIGPEPFYAKACGVAGRRQFVAMKHEFA
jgi:mycothiol synthase